MLLKKSFIYVEMLSSMFLLSQYTSYHVGSSSLYQLFKYMYRLLPTGLQDTCHLRSFKKKTPRNMYERFKETWAHICIKIQDFLNVL